MRKPKGILQAIVYDDGTVRYTSVGLTYKTKLGLLFKILSSMRRDDEDEDVADIEAAQAQIEKDQEAIREAHEAREDGKRWLKAIK